MIAIFWDSLVHLIFFVAKNEEEKNSTIRELPELTCLEIKIKIKVRFHI